MLDIWNDSSVLPPPILTFPCSYNFDSHGLLSICNEMIKVLSKQSPLHQESAILSRLLYKFDKKFRNDIGFRNFKKVNTALRRYLAVNYLKDVESFTSVLPPDDADELYLPTRQMLEYLLVRLQTFSKIMVRIYVCCKLAAVFYLDRIKRGESHWMSLMPYAVLSRIWSMSYVLISHSCRWYNSLYKYLEKLQPKGLPFLPEGYTFPTDLSEWLDVKNIDEFGKYEWSRNKSIKIIPVLGELDDTDGAFDIFKYVAEINDVPVKSDISSTVDKTQETEMVHKIETIQQKEALQKTDFGITVSRESLVNANSKSKDIGQPISREAAKPMQEQQLRMFKDINTKPDKIKRYTESRNKILDNKDHCPEKVTSSETLKKFLKKEEKYRYEENADSLTSHLSFMQWQSLKGTLNKLCNDILANNRKIQRKFEKIWKEKCMDYL